MVFYTGLLTYSSGLLNHNQYTISMKKFNFCPIVIPWLFMILYIFFFSYLLHEYFTDSNILFRLQVASKFMPISNVIIGKD